MLYSYDFYIIVRFLLWDNLGMHVLHVLVMAVL